VKPVHRRKPRPFLNLGQFLIGLSIFEIMAAAGLFYSAGSACVKPRAACTTIAYGCCFAVLIFN